MAHEKQSSLTQLVCKAQEGDTSAFEQIYTLTNNKIYYFALKMVKSPDDAMDIVQDSYISAFIKLGTLKTPESFLSWMYAITANNCKKSFIKNKNVTFFQDEEFNPIDELLEDNDKLLPQAAVDNEETRRLIMDIVDNLPDAQRACIVMYYFSEMSVSEISKIMECSEGTIKSRLNYGRKYIKEAILELEEKEDTKLYKFIPFGAISSLLQDIPEDIFGNTNFADKVWDKISSGITNPPDIPKTEIKTMGAMKSIGSNAVKSGFPAAAKAKVIAGIVAVTAVASGVMMHANHSPALRFEEPAFEAGIRAVLNRSAGDIHAEDLEEICDMQVSDKGFKFYQGDEEDFEQFSGEPTESIVSYSLKDARYLENLSFIELINVSVDTFEPLSDSGVTILSIDNSYADDWNSLEGLSNLDTIRIKYGTENLHFNKLPSMKGLKKLKHLDIIHYLSKDDVYMDISSISEAESLVILQIHGIVLNDLSPLSQLKNLKALILSETNIGDVTPLAGLDKLMLVSISSSRKIEGSEIFRNMPSLKVLIVHDFLGMSLSEEELAERQMDIEGVSVNYNHFDRNIEKEFTDVWEEILNYH